MLEQREPKSFSPTWRCQASTAGNSSVPYCASGLGVERPERAQEQVGPRLKLLVFPSGRREQVETVVRNALADQAGMEEVTLTIVRLSHEWTVVATGLSDQQRAGGLCERVKQVLKQAGI